MSISICRLILAGVLSTFCISTAFADVPKVSTDIAPVQSLVARVMQGLGTPQQLVRQGASPHGYAMRPSEAQNLQDSEVVVWVGPALTPWLERAIATLAPDTSVITLLDTPETHLLEFRKGVQFALTDEDEHGQAHDHAHAHAHADHVHDGLDPHAWLDPENARIWLARIANELARLDPANADIYATNAKAGQAEITAMQARIKEQLATASAARFVVFHDAYHYFEDRFGLEASGAIAAGDATDPSPARIKAVRQLILDQNVICAFSEPSFNQAIVKTVIDGTDARASIIDPLGTSIAPGPGFYPSLIEEIAEKLADCMP